MMQEISTMSSGDCSRTSLTSFFIIFLLVVSAATGATSVQAQSAVMRNGEALGKVEYELPYDLGTLLFGVPSHWVGARAEHVDALWIDQFGTPFKENVTLKVRRFEKGGDEEDLLDEYMEKFVASVSATPTGEVRTVPGRRLLSLEGTVENLEIEQHHLVIYTGTSDADYLITLTNTHLKGGIPVDVSIANIL